MTRTPIFETRLAHGEDEQRAVYALRHRIFVRELGARSAKNGDTDVLERDKFDPFAKSLLLFDKTRASGDQIVGAYRLMDCAGADRAGGFYSEQEYDLSLLRASGRKLLELGRSCILPEYRGGEGIHHLWRGVSRYVDETRAEILFGVASFHGTDISAYAQSLSLLRQRHLAPAELRVRSRTFQPMDLVPVAQIDRVAAMKHTPSLIKAYLRLGGVVGDGAFVDRDFNTTDICMILDTAQITERQRAHFMRG